MQEADLAIDLALMRGAAKFAGDLALEMKRSGDARHWHKSPGNPITEADLAVNRYISNTLRTARPDYGWLSLKRLRTFYMNAQKSGYGLSTR